MKALVAEPTVANLLALGAGALESAGLPTARQDAEWLLAGVLGIDRFRLYMEPARWVSVEMAGQFRARIERRLRHEPLQYILGFEEFRGLRLEVAAEVLIPRPETELLVEWALGLERAHGPWRLAVDVGTGTGAIACALATALPELRVLAVDRSLGALGVAARNVSALGLGRRVRLVAGECLEPLTSSLCAVDLVIGNPPYIPSADLLTLPAEVREWEPREALDGGPDGLAVHRRLIEGAAALLGRGGWLLMEMGEGQADPLGELMAARGFDGIEVRRDLGGAPRMIGARRE